MSLFGVLDESKKRAELVPVSELGMDESSSEEEEGGGGRVFKS